MAPLRVRHPKGVSTIEVDFENDSVEDLQGQILSVSEVMPSQQEIKSGYPPKPLVIIPELPLSSLGLKRGDQLTVTQRTGSGHPVSSVSASSTAPAKTKPLPPPATQPAPPIGKKPTSSSRNGSVEFVETDAGTLVHRVVPDDNSCLFSSIALIFERNIGKAQSIRQIIAQAIRNNPTTWNEAILGRSPEEYIRTITKPTAWGGAIELSILATHYNTEISSIDVETGRIDSFEPSSSPSGNRCVVIYSGIHYDAASLAPSPDAPEDFHTTLFPIMGNKETDLILQAAKELAGKLRAKKAYTNTATFDLKCEICKKGLKGEKEARAHAMATGHTEFGEY